ncbi:MULTISPECIES: 16S rRNA (guanine(966)-N(2))-methyltransferase RsmD [Actinoplanes]|uniref:16S rRNA (Guanine(966)-N(2))-methyltransferase RsmD n=2 Tax=Actinoplanes TaxID=1865 RepID=A0A0X3V6Y7_9ACTN|nr:MULTISPECIES: 16S rRNA (guanine(966)-N(2))-methyltransferase RsmD [Actinoplanes]KUL40571.1 16S rRNA (guanine(966)-N(2))-methyltransferase RsmD [Actinoplanes awajinensis subsp. mycoplanecinus]GIE71054.1 DNA methylase [Actinoplanes palleronii]
MTRIIAGAHGGRRLSAPPGALTRPTSDRVREAFFSSLHTMTDLSGARFVDLYAGSGAVGLEALSRGAVHTLLVEAEPKAARVIRENIATLRVTDQARLVTAKVLQVVGEAPTGGPYDVVFADPPYALGNDEIDGVQQGLLANGWLAPDAVVVFERSKRTELTWVDGLEEDRTRRYGETTIWYGRRS